VGATRMGDDLWLNLSNDSGELLVEVRVRVADFANRFAGWSRSTGGQLLTFHVRLSFWRPVAESCIGGVLACFFFVRIISICQNIARADISETSYLSLDGTERRWMTPKFLFAII
jgi:hypothetical protein